MGNLTVRRLDYRAIERLKAQAKANQHSLEGEVHHVLTRQVDRGGARGQRLGPAGILPGLMPSVPPAERVQGRNETCPTTTTSERTAER